MLQTRDAAKDKRPTQTESEGMETNFPSKWTGKKKSRGSNTDIRQSELQKEPEKETLKVTSQYSREESIKKT